MMSYSFSRTIGLAAMCFFLGAMPAMASVLRVLKVTPEKSQIVVDKGTESGLTDGSDVVLHSSSGKDVSVSVSKAVRGKALLNVPSKFAKAFKPGQSFSFGDSGSRRGGRGGPSLIGTVEVNPGSLVLGAIDGGVQFRVGNQFTVGMSANDYVTASIKGVGFGPEARYYFDRAFEGFFLGGGVYFQTASITDPTQPVAGIVTISVKDLYGLIGYQHQFTRNFHAILGGGIRYYMPSLTDDQLPDDKKPDRIENRKSNPVFEFPNPLYGMYFVTRAALVFAF